MLIEPKKKPKSDQNQTKMELKQDQDITKIEPKPNQNGTKKFQNVPTILKCLFIFYFLQISIVEFRKLKNISQF